MARHLKTPYGCQTSRDRTRVTLAVLLGEDMAIGLTPIRRLKRRAMDPRNKSGGSGKVRASIPVLTPISQGGRQAYAMVVT